MAIVGYIVTVLAAYLAGSIPAGFLVARARGLDIRTIGSGNIGATNAFRVLGVPAGIMVLLFDAFKGWIAVWVFAPAIGHWAWPDAGPTAQEWFRICAAFSAVLGHNFTCWLRFKGGKGIATSAGVLLALVPGALCIILSVFVIVLALTRYVSLGSICASVSLPFASWITGKSLVLILVTGAMGAMAVWKHKANIKRLLNGTESRLGRKSPTPRPSSTASSA